MDQADRLAVYKALGDDTRFALYAELRASPVPLSTSDLAERMALHPNTVRPHLERMREAGLLEVEMDSRGTVGRPQHRYRPTPGAPGVDLDPPSYQLLAELLAQLAGARSPRGGLDPEAVAAVGRTEGRRLAASQRSGRGRGARPACVEALRAAMERLGFEPILGAPVGARVEMLFANCPFRDLAEAHPDVVCHLHRGIVEGVAELVGNGRVVEFATLEDNRPCRAEVVEAVR
ncbi:MAG TPA: helix-turn-helix domain-containing protein [Acidimicrobiales bacterium]|nr:helix-turn-helix domain-containing protein [Acidimicrobiales bacterium]